MSFHRRVNGFLAEWVSTINALVAVGVPVVTALSMGLVAGSSFGRFSVLGFLGGCLAGGLAGLLLAGSACGVLAVLIDIRNSLAAQAGRSSNGEHG